jgi:tripartite-type tricarboxylate transporter receptor subunit TctC
MAHIAYRGAVPALHDRVAGKVQTIADSQPSAPPLNKDNRLIPIAVMAPQRLALLPGVPTLKEVGLEPVSRMDGGILAPKGTPKAVVDAVAATAKRILEETGVRKSIKDTGTPNLGNKLGQFAAQMKSRREGYRSVVAKQRLKLD